MPDQNSPLWSLLRLIVVSGVALVAVSVGYQQGFVAKSDIPVVLAIAGSLLGGEVPHYLSGRSTKPTLKIHEGKQQGKKKK